MEQQRKVARRTGLPKDHRPGWSLIDWMLTRLPIRADDDLDKLVAEVVQTWQDHAPKGRTRKPTTEDHGALIDLLTGASMCAAGEHFTPKGVEHYKGSLILQGWFVQAMSAKGGA